MFGENAPPLPRLCEWRLELFTTRGDKVRRTADSFYIHSRENPLQTVQTLNSFFDQGRVGWGNESRSAPRLAE